MEVVPGERGKPEVKFYGKAKEFLDASGAQRALVTITHAREYAVAAVVLDSDGS